MDNYIRTKHLHLVFIIMALMLITGSSSSEVTGITGSNVMLTFTFNKTDDNNKFNYFNIYNSTENKFDDVLPGKPSNKFTINEANASVSYLMTNLSKQHEQEYYATWVINGTFKTSDKVRLMVIVDNKTTTVAPGPTLAADREVSQSLLSRMVLLILVSPLLLLATALPCVVWCLLTTRGSKQKPQDSSIATVQESVAAYQPQVPAPSLVYSVLDFPQRPPTALDINNDTHYATISYLPDNSQV